MEPFTFTIAGGRENTDGSCAVLAIAASTGCSYETALACATEIGFKPRVGTPMYRHDAGQIIKKHTGAQIATYEGVLDTEAATTSSLWMLRGQNAPATLASFMKKAPKGRYMVSVKGHIFAVVDGNVIDNGYYYPTEHAVRVYGRRSIVAIFKVTQTATPKSNPAAAVQLTLW